MFKHDALEAAPLAARMLTALLGAVPTRGRQGADLRTAVGDFIANAVTLFQFDTAGPPMAACFDLARIAGATQKQLARVRVIVMAEEPVSLGATLAKNAGIALCLAAEGDAIASMSFITRDDVNALKALMNGVFAEVEGVAADNMDAASYRAMVELHAAITFHLVETARPLPRLLQFQFASTQSTLTLAYRLYDDAGRADEVREENRVVHPAFVPLVGIALSA